LTALAEGNNNTKKLRKKGGAYLKALREDAGLTQRALAEMAGFKYYTFISQIEHGAGKIPSELYEAYADAVGANRVEFIKCILMYYDPHVYKILYGGSK